MRPWSAVRYAAGCLAGNLYDDQMRVVGKALGAAREAPAPDEQQVRGPAAATAVCESLLPHADWRIPTVAGTAGGGVHRRSYRLRCVARFEVMSS